MNVHVFNAALVLAWLLVSAGAGLLHPAAGLIVAGLLLLGLVFVSVRLAGGVYAPQRERG